MKLVHNIILSSLYPVQNNIHECNELHRYTGMCTIKSAYNTEMQDNTLNLGHINANFVGQIKLTKGFTFRT